MMMHLEMTDYRICSVVKALNLNNSSHSSRTCYEVAHNDYSMHYGRVDKLLFLLQSSIEMFLVHPSPVKMILSGPVKICKEL